ncbi:HK97 family phage prohead protease [Motilimonas cestriensis]|uniref:HK97 family phage prohead protease n=1 Tax=Motilimonas cestriensis TaxID=2742685 RepID=A0ABS8WF66_9GAMM|nr:HK97 family phage prohead protease [Motilimonas cestriensis]MCE2597208.1 HK97 family phage prohead protease [Motilimonas cestriensis]
MLTRKKIHVELKIKQVSESGEFEGYGSVFGVKDSHKDIVLPGAFANSLAEWSGKGQFPSMLWQHKMDEPVGVYTEMREDDVGLFVKGRLLIDDDPLAKRAHAHLKAGSIKGLSIGYELIDWEWSADKGAYILKEIKLWEVSLVTFPSNEEARVAEVKTALEKGETPSPKMIERALREVGFSRSQSKAFMSKGFSALNQREADLESGLNALRKLSQQF